MFPGARVQDTPGCQEEGAVTQAVLGFIDQENAAYMSLEQARSSPWPSPQAQGGSGMHVGLRGLHSLACALARTHVWLFR